MSQPPSILQVPAKAGGAEPGGSDFLTFGGRPGRSSFRSRAGAATGRLGRAGRSRDPSIGIVRGASVRTHRPFGAESAQACAAYRSHRGIPKHAGEGPARLSRNRMAPALEPFRAILRQPGHGSWLVQAGSWLRPALPRPRLPSPRAVAGAVVGDRRQQRVDQRRAILRPLPSRPGGSLFHKSAIRRDPVPDGSGASRGETTIRLLTRSASSWGALAWPWRKTRRTIGRRLPRSNRSRRSRADDRRPSRAGRDRRHHLVKQPARPPRCTSPRYSPW